MKTDNLNLIISDLKAAHLNIALAVKDFMGCVDRSKDGIPKRKWQRWLYEAAVFQEEVLSAIDAMENSDTTKNELLERFAALQRKAERLPTLPGR